MNLLKTYQDLIQVGDNEQNRIDFIKAVISEHMASPVYRTAMVAQDYYDGTNTTITNYNKYIRDVYGRNIPDIWSPNHKIACHYYGYLINQLALFMLGNGVSFTEASTKERLGKSFDKVMVGLLIDALNGGVSYAFANMDKVEPFSAREFAPLYDEETGHLRSGVRFWRLDDRKPLRCTLYEEDGYTEYIEPIGEKMTILNPKRAYIEKVSTSAATGEISVEGMNYPTFPIVPLYNVSKRSELVGNREVHDALDLMLSGLINNVDSGEVVYWILKNSGGFDQVSMNQFLQTLKTSHVAAVDSEDDVTAHSPVVNFQASKEAIEQLRRQIFDNHMGLDVKEIAGGAVTATQIRAAYEPLNSKADLVELRVTECINGILAVFGIDDEPTYTRSYIINQNEAVQTIVTAGTELPSEYKTRKILEILGDIDKVDEVLNEVTAEDMDRFGADQPSDQTEEQPEPTEQG